MNADEHKYWAFISYSHRDKRWGDWLHKAIETYRVPRKLVGRKTPRGVVPRQIYPVFRDRDELPSSSNLNDAIRDALQQSRYLIVICSPRSAQSRWVNEEIKTFKSLGREGRILCLIVDGEPNVTDKPEHEAQECFAPALRYGVASDGSLTDQRVEPVAADVRPLLAADGKRNARLKIVAGLAGLDYGVLKDREAARRATRRILLSVAALAIAALVAGIWSVQEYAKRRDVRAANIETQRQADLAEQRRREAAQRLVEDYERQALVWLEDREDPVTAAFYFAKAAAEESAASLTPGDSAVWLQQMGRTLPTLIGAEERRFDVVFNADKTRFVVDTTDGPAQVWDVATGQAVGEPMHHESGVTSAAFSRNGKYVITATLGAVQVWDAGSGTPVGVPVPFSEIRDVSPAQFSPDAHLVVAFQHYEAQIWETETGRPVGEPMRHKEFVDAATFSPDGHAVLTVSNSVSPIRGGETRVWDATTGKALVEPMQHEGPVLTATFSPDGRWILTTWKSMSHQQGTDSPVNAQLWAAATRKPVGEPVHGITFAAFSPDGHWLLAASSISGESAAALWNVMGEKPALEGLPMRHQSEVTSAAFSSDGRMVITVSGKSAHVWDIAADGNVGQAIGHIMPHDGLINSAAFSPDGKLVVTASDDGTAQIWTVPMQSPPCEPMRHHGGVESAVFSANGQHVITVSGGGVLKWDIDLGQSVGAAMCHDDSISSASFSPDGRRILTASHDGTARVWDAVTGTPVGVPLSHGQTLSTARYSSDGTRIVTGSFDGTARVWDGAAGQPIGRPMQHEAAVTSALFSPNGDWVLTSSKDGTARIWEALTGAVAGEPMRHEGEVSTAAFSPDGQRIATACEDGTMRIWDAATRRPVGYLMKHDNAFSSSASFSADGRTILTASWDTARVWNSLTGQPLGPPVPHEREVTPPVFSPDGRWVVTIPSQFEVRVWEATTGVPVSLPMRHRHSVTVARFSPDGRWVVTASRASGPFHGGNVRIWDAATGRPVGMPIWHDHDVSFAVFGPNGTRLMSVSGNCAQVLAFGIRPAVVPAWLIVLPERVTGLRLTRDDILVHVPPDEAAEERNRWVKDVEAAAQSGDAAAQFVIGRWAPRPTAGH